MLSANDASTTPQPIILTSGFDKIFLASPLIKNPKKGRSGINQTISNTFFIKYFSQSFNSQVADGIDLMFQPIQKIYVY